MKRSKSKRFLHAAIEKLELRRLLSTQINGSAGDDTFIISVDGNNNTNLIFNGVPQTVPPPADKNMEVFGLGGSDTIILQNTGTLSWDLLGGDGDDHYIIGNGHLLSDIKTNTTVGETGSNDGNDTLVINDQLGGGVAIYSFTTLGMEFGTQFSSQHTIAFATLQHASNEDHITVQGSNGDDQVFVDGFPRNAFLELGDGEDIVDIGGLGNVVRLADLPASSTISCEAGDGMDTVYVDDSDASSATTNLKFDAGGLLGGLRLDGFNGLGVNTHAIAGGSEPVTFRGDHCLAPFLLIVGVSGDDSVQLGEPGVGIFSSGFAANVSLDLKGGFNTVEINDQPINPTVSWEISDAGLTGAGGGGTHINTPANTPLNLNINGTNGNDTFTVIDMPAHWGLSVFASGGNDLLQMGVTKDLDNVFDEQPLLFDGGAGTDSVILSDTQDQLGDNDDYEIATTFLAKGDFGASRAPVLDYQFVDTLQIDLDDDTNRVFFDFSGFKNVTVNANGGSDVFLNQATGVVPSNRLDLTMTDHVTLNGGAGNDVLSLDDSGHSAGAGGAYSIAASTVGYVDSSENDTMTFSSFATVELTGSGRADTATISAKPTGATLNFTAGDGDDSVTVGGGDLDSTGLLTNSGVTITGGAGNDTIIFDDRLDTDTDGTTSNYTMTSNVFAKGSLSFVYTSYEKQTLLSADAVVAGHSNAVPQIRLDQVKPAFLDLTTIVGGLNRGSVLDVANGNLNNLSGLLDIHNCTTVNINDQSTTAASTYQVTATQISRNSFAFASYSGVGSLRVNCGTGNDSASALGTPAGMSLTINGDNGNDTMTMGNGNIDSDLLGPVTLNGAGGSDHIIIDNHADTSTENLTLNNLDFIDNGISYGFSVSSTTGSINLNLGPGGTNLTVTGGSAPATVTGGSGNDTMTVGGGNIEASFPRSVVAGFVYDGGGGTDSIIINDFNATATGSYAFERPTGIDRLTRGDGDFWYLNWMNMESATLEASNAATTGNGEVLTVVAGGLTPIRINGNGGSDAVFVQDASFPVTVNTGAGTLDWLDVNQDAGAGDAPVTVIVDQNDEIDSLTVRAGGTLRISSGATLAKSRLNGTSSLFSVTGTIDLAGGAFLSRAGGPTLSTFQTLLTSGRNGGAWNGTSASGAINSSLATGGLTNDGVGYGLGSQITPTTIGGFAIAAGDTLIRYTYNGDGNLNGKVDGGDYAKIDSAFNMEHTAGNISGWMNGDFDYNAKIDGGDYALIDLAFNSQGSVLGPSTGPSSSPFQPREKPAMLERLM